MTSHMKPVECIHTWLTYMAVNRKEVQNKMLLKTSRIRCNLADFMIFEHTMDKAVCSYLRLPPLYSPTLFGIAVVWNNQLCHILSVMAAPWRHHSVH